jgi:rare lipoprotein A
MHALGNVFPTPFTATRILVVLLAVAILTVSAGCRLNPFGGERSAEKGVASWYGNEFHGRKTASGERFNQEAMTAAHRTLPFGTVVRVEHLDSGRDIKVRINDRGPFVRGRIIDLSKGAARELGMLNQGIAKVRVEVLKWGRHG